MNNEKNTGRAVAGFFLTFITTIMFIAGGILGSLKLSILNGSDIDEFLDNINFYSVAQEIVVTEIKSQISDDKTGSDIAGSLTENAVDKMLSEDIVKDMAHSITNAITKDEEINLGDVKDKCIDAVTDISNQAVEDIFDEISSTTDVVDYNTLQNSTVLQQYQQDYNINITNFIVDQIENKYGEPSVNIEQIDIEEVKAEAKNAVICSAVPMIEQSIDTYIDEANKVANEQVAKIKESGEVSRLTGAFEVLMGTVNIALVISLAIAVTASLIMLFVVYVRKKNKAFRNMAIATGVSAVVMMIFGWALSFIKGMLGNIINNGNSEEIIRDFVAGNISKISGDMFLVGALFVLMFAVFTGVSLFVKKKAQE